MDNDVMGMGSTNRQACAACKHQRKKCSQQCLLSPFFPAEKNQEFQAVHKLFGVSNVTKLLKSLRFDERQQAIDSLIWEAQRRESDPILGCYGDYIKILNEVQLLRNQQTQQQHEVIAAAAAAAQTDHVENMMNNKPLMIDYDPYHNNSNNDPYHNNSNNGMTGGGAGVDTTTMVNYNNNNYGYLQRNVGLIMEQNQQQQQQQHQHGYGPSMNVQGQEKRFQTRDSTNGHVICVPTSFNQSHHTLYYDSGKL